MKIEHPSGLQFSEVGLLDYKPSEAAEILKRARKRIQPVEAVTRGLRTFHMEMDRAAAEALRRDENDTI